MKYLRNMILNVKASTNYAATCILLSVALRRKQEAGMVDMIMLLIIWLSMHKLKAKKGNSL